MVVKISDPFGVSVFCDDIRFELGNKTSLIGIYREGMQIHAPFPCAVPRFGIFVQWFIPIVDKDKPRSPLTISVLGPGATAENPAITTELLTENILWGENLNLPALEDPDAQQMGRVEYPFLFAPFILAEPGYIRVRGTIDGITYKLGSLRVTQGEIPTPN
jgi:hypothetical protein